MPLFYESIEFSGATASATVTVSQAHAVSTVIAVGNASVGYVLTGSAVGASSPRQIAIDILIQSTVGGTLIPNATATGTVTAIVLYDGY